MSERLYHASVLESCTEDQWHDLEGLYITEDEARIVLKVLEILILKRKQKAQQSG